MKRILFFPDANDAGGAPPAAEPILPPPGDVVVPPAANPGEPPPAATIAVESTPTEGERNLQAQLDSEKEARKKEQLRIMELEDANKRLKDVTTTEKPAKKKPGKGSWGLLQFED